MTQIMIALTGVVAIWLTQQSNNSIKKYACLFGMAGQPFWFYSAYSNEQWGVFALCFFYTYSWGVGIYNWIVEIEPDIWIHLKTGNEYKSKAYGKMKVGDEWKRSIIYHNIHDQDRLFTRELSEFNEKFVLKSEKR